MAQASSYLLDTNILLHLIRGNNLGQTIDQIYNLRSSLGTSMISVVTVGESYSLARKFNWGQDKCESLEKLLDEIVWIDINHPDILDAYAILDHESQKLGRTMGKNDVWIAATARTANVPLLTTDRDFDHLHGTFVTLNFVDPDHPE